MSGFEAHKARAADCFRRSRQAHDEEAKAFFLSLAQLWVALAHEHVRMERVAEGAINADHVKRQQ
jgi:hypothetical protein